MLVFLRIASTIPSFSARSSLRFWKSLSMFFSSGLDVSNYFVNHHVSFKNILILFLQLWCKSFDFIKNILGRNENHYSLEWQQRGFQSLGFCDPNTTFLQVLPCKKVAKCTLSFHNLTSSRMVEVSLVREIKTFFYYYFRKNQTKNQTNVAQRGGRGGCNPLDPSPGSASEGRTNSNPFSRPVVTVLCKWTITDISF